ncbi:hypothetical protein [Phenylobacterium soli]|uniref:Lipoprotein n=2 Tax=Phenylobacterium soli TaxID=2170551 RepID=A0A328AAI2_9CAUL|nr:hypothetical protein [Phenylobacterium soli]RAK51692.1 hypothetical protein DJ017_17825 [Phenylobacterium soli]
MAYKLRSMHRVRLIAALALTSAVAACAPSLGPPPPGYVPPPAPGEPGFRASEFGWSQAPGTSAISGRLTYTRGQNHYSCQGASVILTPETPWSKRRMEVLYLSSERAALPAEEVRARTAEAPPGDSSPFIKRTVCDAQERFSFTHLPAGAWYVITIAKPVKGGESLALMRRVVTKGGKASVVTF